MLFTYRKRNKNIMPILMVLITLFEQPPENTAIYFFLNFGSRGQAIFSFNKLQAQYKFGFYRLSKKSWHIVITIENNFFREKSTKRFWLYHSIKVGVEYTYIDIIAYSTWICTIVRTERSNSNHIVTKAELPGDNPKLYGYSIPIPFSIE